MDLRYFRLTKNDYCLLMYRGRGTKALVGMGMRGRRRHARYLEEGISVS
jgi:hypothetical protein